MPKGVMSNNYTSERIKKNYLSFRYKVRARIVAYSIRKYIDNVDESFNILDFGSAEGLALFELYKLIKLGSYRGVEFSEELLRNVPYFPSQISIIHGDVTRLPSQIKEHRYDVVSALAVLEHLSNPLTAILEARKVLRLGGIFVATCPEPSWDNISRVLRLNSSLEDCHVGKLGRKQMIDLVKRSGMELLEFRRFMWAPIAFLPYIKVPVSPSLSLKIDAFINNLKIFNAFFVNQCVIARKPLL